MWLDFRASYTKWIRMCENAEACPPGYQISGLPWSWCQVYGAEHNVTISTERALKEISTHVVIVNPFMQQFEAL